MYVIAPGVNFRVTLMGGRQILPLAVPAGAVYYFEADSEMQPKNLVFALTGMAGMIGARLEIAVRH